jgi:hypothetical protein
LRLGIHRLPRRADLRDRVHARTRCRFAAACARRPRGRRSRHPEPGPLEVRIGSARLSKVLVGSLVRPRWNSAMPATKWPTPRACGCSGFKAQRKRDVRGPSSGRPRPSTTAHRGKRRASLGWSASACRYGCRAPAKSLRASSRFTLRARPKEVAGADGQRSSRSPAPIAPGDLRVMVAIPLSTSTVTQAMPGHALADPPVRSRSAFVEVQAEPRAGRR